MELKYGILTEWHIHQLKEAEIEEIYSNKSYTSVSWDKVGSLKVNEEIKGKYIDDLVSMVNIKPGLKLLLIVLQVQEMKYLLWYLEKPDVR